MTLGFFFFFNKLLGDNVLKGYVRIVCALFYQPFARIQEDFISYIQGIEEVSLLCST